MAPEIDIEVSGPGVKGRAKASVRSDRTVLAVAWIVGGTFLAAIVVIGVFALLIALAD